MELMGLAVRSTRTVYDMPPQPLAGQPAYAAMVPQEWGGGARGTLYLPANWHALIGTL